MDYARGQQTKATVLWQRAFRFALANATAFFLFSCALFLFEVESLLTLISAPTLFFLGSSISFVMLIRCWGGFAAFAWFTLSAGLYFGLGVVLGALDPDPRTIHYLSSTVLSADLMRINFLNSSSVLLVSIGAMPLCYAPRLRDDGRSLGYHETITMVLKFFPLIIILACIALVLQFIVFPVAQNLIVRVFLSSLSLSIPYCALTLGLLWTRLDKFWARLGAIVFLLALGLAVLSTSKYATISMLLALIGGSWIRRHSTSSVITGVIVLAAAYFFLGGITNQARLHEEYDAGENSPLTRLKILADTIIDYGVLPESMQDHSRGNAEIPGTLRRFSITAIQGFLIDQYERDSPGTSLKDFWVAAIPRVLWPEKPIVTRFGSELHEEFWLQEEAESAIAPTYSAEAYWNYGPAGLVIVSVLLGLEIGWLTRRWQIAASGADPAFLAIAFPVALMAAYVETWIAATYIGGFITLVVLWGCVRLVFRKPPGGVLLRSFHG